MAEHYTDEDVHFAVLELERGDCLGVIGGSVDRQRARMILDAVAPAIAARALREAATDARQAFLSGKTLGMPSDVWLERRADEIEGR